jgi:hypothetical protein
MRYRIYYKRFDTDETCSEFDAVSDEAASQEFDRRSADPANAWDDMKLVRVDQVEKVTKIKHNDNFQRMLDRD